MANDDQHINLQDVLTSHDCLKRATDLPLLHTNKCKETPTGWWLIKIVEIAANIATWDDKGKSRSWPVCSEDKHELGGTA